jgi:hypothetical protein
MRPALASFTTARAAAVAMGDALGETPERAAAALSVLDQLRRSDFERVSASSAALSASSS